MMQQTMTMKRGMWETHSDISVTSQALFTVWQWHMMPTLTT